MYKYITHTRKILADLYTPVGVYIRLRDLYPQSALMESSDYHGNDNSRSFICINPIASISVGHNVVTKNYPDGSVVTNDLSAIPAPSMKDRVGEEMSAFLRDFSVTGESSDFCGLYGYTSFNAVRYFENIPVKDTTMPKNDAPDILYILYRDIIVFSADER